MNVDICGFKFFLEATDFFFEHFEFITWPYLSKNWSASGHSQKILFIFIWKKSCYYVIVFNKQKKIIFCEFLLDEF